MPDPLLSLLVAALIGGACAVIWWPETGLYWRWRRAQGTSRRVLAEDALKHIYQAELAGGTVTRRDLAVALHRPEREIGALMAEMVARGLLETDVEPLTLSAAGTEHALHIVRAHRLWERYLAETTGFGATEWHRLAEDREHQLSPAELDALAARLNHPTYDPHGDPIPTADGRIAAPEWQDLNALTAGQAGRIMHLEDEPTTVYAQLVAEGLAPGIVLRVLESTAHRIRFWADGNEHVLAPQLAANVSVVPLPANESPQEISPSARLSALRPGQQATVTGIAPACRGAERRRFLDLGILPGTQIEAALASPSGNPIAYRIRGALIALRYSQAHHIQIEHIEETAA